MEHDHQCYVCNKKAQYFCGHGCETTYCGESCAKSVYNVHKQMCSELIEWPWGQRQQHAQGHSFGATSFSNAEQMYKHFVLQGPSPINMSQRIPPILASLHHLDGRSRQTYINMFVQAVAMVYNNHPDRFPAGSPQLQQLVSYQNQAHQIR